MQKLEPIDLSEPICEDELYDKTWALWGGPAQIDVLVEEMAELTQALMKSRRHGGRESVTYTYAIYEETADVCIMLGQLIRRLESFPVMDEPGVSCLMDRVTEIMDRKHRQIAEHYNKSLLRHMEDEDEARRPA